MAKPLKQNQRTFAHLHRSGCRWLVSIRGGGVMFLFSAWQCRIMAQYVAICRIAHNNSLATFGDLGQGSAASVKVGMQRSTNPNRFSNKLSNRFPAYHLDPFVTQVYFVLWESMWYLEKMCGPFYKTEMIWYIYVYIYIIIFFSFGRYQLMSMDVKEEGSKMFEGWYVRRRSIEIQQIWQI